LANQLASYFGDDDDASAIELIRDDMRTSSETRRSFRDGLAEIIANPDFECGRLVENCANRVAPTREAGRAWLVALQKKLFGDEKKGLRSPSQKPKRRPAT
jgi:hypothetical protein